MNRGSLSPRKQQELTSVFNLIYQYSGTFNQNFYNHIVTNGFTLVQARYQHVKCSTCNTGHPNPLGHSMTL